MKVFFQKLFHIYSGEEKNAFLFAFLGFLWALAVTLGQKFADALFLLHVGPDSLPLAYMLTACAMILLASFLLKAFHIISIHRIFITVLMVAVCFYLGVHFCLSAKLGVTSPIFWFALKIFGSILFAVVVTCFWTLIDQYYHMQDAKRLYSLFTSAIFLGVALTGTIMRSGMIDFEHLTLFIIALLLFTAYWTMHIIRSAKPVYDENTLESSGDGEVNSFKYLVQSILQSRFTLLLMAGNFLIFVFLVITEFSYLSAFDRYFDPGLTLTTGAEQKAGLTRFLGQCLASVSIINLLVGLFLYSRLVRRFGINNLLLCTPIFLFITYSGWIVSDSLLFPVMGFFIVEGLLYVIDDNNFTLLLNAVPHKLKYKIRLIIESFFEPIGMLVSSLLITFVPISSIQLGLILAMVALIVAWFLRKSYLQAIYLNLSENAVHFHRSVRDWFANLSIKQKKISKRRLLAIIQIGDESAQLLALEALLSFGTSDDIPKLLQLTHNFSFTNKIIFLEKIGKSQFSSDTLVLRQLYFWLNENPSSELRSAIHFYLAQQGVLGPESTISDLNSSDLVLQGAAILSLKRTGLQSSLGIESDNYILANQRLYQLIESGIEDKICMGLSLLKYDAIAPDSQLLLSFLKNPSINVARSAAAAIISFSEQDPYVYVPALLSQLRTTSDTELRQYCLRAVGKIGEPYLSGPLILCSVHFRPNERRLAEEIISGMGVATVPALLAIAKNTAINDRCRLLAGRILGRVSLPKLRENLYSIVSVEIERAYFYIYHLYSIQDQYPEIDLKLLQDDLLSSFHSVLDFIIQLLSVAGEIENSELLSQCLRSPNPKVRSQVIETLEKTCDAKIFRALYPLVADLPHEEKMQTYLKQGFTPLTLTDLLDKMSLSPIQGDQLVALALQYRLDLPNWRELLKLRLSSKEEIFHHFAYELL